MARWVVLCKVPLGNTRTYAQVPRPTTSAQAMPTVRLAFSATRGPVTPSLRMIRRDSLRDGSDWAPANVTTWCTRSAEVLGNP